MENKEKLIGEAQTDGIVIYDNKNQRFQCRICDKPMTGIISVVDHLVNSKHTETAARIAISDIRSAPRSFLRVLSPEVTAAAEEGIIEVVVPPGGSPGILCKVCVKPLTGLAPLQQHLLGSDHRKKLGRSRLPSYPQSPSGGYNTWNQLSNGSLPNTSYQVPIVESQVAPIGHQISHNTASNTQNPYTRNQEPNQTPIEATSHTWNQGSLSQQNEDQIIRYNRETTRYECLVCRMPILGDSREIDDHLSSKGHREEGVRYVIENPDHVPRCLMDLLPQGAIEATRAGFLYINQSRAFQCRPCDKIFTGVPPLKEHLVGFDHHMRTGKVLQEQQGAAQHFLPQDDTAMEELSKAFEKGVAICTDNSNDQISCTVCNVTLHGHKNLADHLNGKKHQKKQMQQEIHNQNVVPPNNRTDGHHNNSRRFPDSPGIEPTPGRGLSNPTQNTEGIQPSLLPYRVLSIPPGQVHIFNFLFLGRTEDPKERKGAQRDSVSLMNTFSRMRYQVFCHEDLTRDETNQKLDEIRNDKVLVEVDVLVIFFLSHGNQPFTFYACDRQELDLREIWNKFTDSGCPALKKKPKIFFTNFCRGTDGEIIETDATIDVPRDMVTIHASTERITALRSPKHGTHFVRALCHILESDNRKLELREIYHLLDVEVKALGGRQPKWEDNRFRKFYFNPYY